MLWVFIVNVLICIFFNFDEADSGYSALLGLANQLIIVLVILSEINVISPVTSQGQIQSLACIQFISLEA